MTRKSRAMGLLVAAAAMASCSYNPNSYSCFSTIDPTEGWAYGNTFVYMPEITDSMAQGRLKLMVRHTNDYEFSNLWLEVQSQQPADSGHVELLTDTFCISLADVYGNWRGSGSGATFESLDTLYSDFTLINGAPLRLRHIMRPERVEGLEKIGFIFEPYSTE
ncbi:MAG: gliding motility lipoprotein GldH [Muribaculaceae bacterium]|nr:gliding motility lipoprotein GldH [Muribaculaceae bacterium]MDE7335258.1 gliding motility lipoprotein GldH [Muribaculaceae bacterium]